MIGKKQIEETIRKYLMLEQYPKSKSKQDLKSKNILEILTSRRFCHKKPDSGLMKILSKRLEERIKKNEPIVLNVLHGPRKNPNATDINYAEWAELFTLFQLARLYHRIKPLYDPSLKIRIFCDDARALAVNDYSSESMESYIESLRLLIKNTKLDKIIEVIKFNEIYDQYNALDYLTEAEKRVKKWESYQRNKEKIKEMDEHCRKNLILSYDLQPEKRIKISSYLYRVYLEAERLAGIYDISDVWATYREEPNFLFIYSLTKGNITQPWQGEGCLRLLPSEKLVPYVLTQERRLNLEIIEELEIFLPKLPKYMRTIKLAR